MMNNRLLTKTLKFKNTEQMSGTVSMLALSPVVSLRLHFIQPSISTAKKKPAFTSIRPTCWHMLQVQPTAPHTWCHAVAQVVGKVCFAQYS